MVRPGDVFDAARCKGCGGGVDASSEVVGGHHGPAAGEVREGLDGVESRGFDLAGQTPQAGWLGISLRGIEAQL